MSAWSGFTDEELKKLRQEDKAIDEENARPKERIKKSTIDNRTKRRRPREKIQSRPAAHLQQDEQTQGEIAKINNDTEKSRSEAMQEGREVDEMKEGRQSAPTEREKVGAENAQQVASTSSKIDKQDTDTAMKEIDIKIISPEELASLEMTAMEKMQKQQKEMEELNKKKKLLLQQTIKQRYRKTQTETATLVMVQKELAHLDNLLTVDVTILREKIDEASRSYHYAQKRYEKAEAEFVAAKVELHTQEQRKEALTEHLYSLIQENEKRKAAKLEELMARLDLAHSMADSVVLCETEGVQTDLDLEQKAQPAPAKTGSSITHATGTLTDTTPPTIGTQSDGIPSSGNAPPIEKKPADSIIIRDTNTTSVHVAGEKTGSSDKESSPACPSNTDVGQAKEPLRDNGD